MTSTQLKRAGLDYWKYINVLIHNSFNEFVSNIPKDSTKVFLSTKAKIPYFDCNFKPGTYFIFGKETKGLPENLIKENWESCFKIPIFDGRVRSLNLANAVGIVLYEAIRQLKANDSF